VAEMKRKKSKREGEKRMRKRTDKGPKKRKRENERHMRRSSEKIVEYASPHPRVPHIELELSFSLPHTLRRLSLADH
jgi:hypothetical protein